MKHYRQLQKELATERERRLELFAQKSELEYRLSMQNEAEAHFQRQEQEIRSLHQNVRSLKHDMKNHMMVLASYLNSGEYEEARRYTSGILDKLNAMHSYIETGNSLLNHILNEKLALARSYHIEFRAEIETLSFARMQSIDFSALLTNLLDNSIEAGRNEPSPELHIRIFKKQGYDSIHVKNKIGKSVLQENPELCSTKKKTELHGLGIPRIKEIVTAYGGMYDFYEEDGYFCSCVFIPQ